MKKIFAALLALLMMFSFVACDSDKKDSDGKKDKNGEETTVEASANENESEKYYDSSKVQKLGTTKLDDFRCFDGSNGMYSVLSVDGKKETGFIYNHCMEVPYANEYLTARVKDITSSTDLALVNSAVLIDWNADILAEGYCDYIYLNSKYFVVAKAIGVNVDGSGDLELYTDDGEISYDAEFYLYDIAARKTVDGIKSYSDDFEYSGMFIGYTDENGEEKIINLNGYDVPEGVEFLPSMSSAHEEYETGYYVIEENRIGKIYNDRNEVVYTYCEDPKSSSGYDPIFKENGYILAARRRDTESADYSDYVVMDENFKPVTSVVTLVEESSTTVGQYNGLFSLHNILYDATGKAVYEFLTCKTINGYREKVDYFLFIDSESTVLINQNAEVIYKGTVEGTVEFDQMSYAAYRQIGEERWYYCSEDGDFTVKTGTRASVGRYLVKVEEEDGTKSVVDLKTGEKIITGYYDYCGKAIEDDSYILAQYQNGTSDLFMVAG